MNLFAEYQLVIIVSIITSYFILGIYQKLNPTNFLIGLKSILIITIIDIVMSIISIIPSMIKINKMNINSIIKESI